MTEISIRDLKSRSQCANIASKREMRRPLRASGRDFTYTVVRQCEDGSTTEFVYLLRGDLGSYREDWCGDALNGALSYVEDIVFTSDGLSIPGHVYNGVDELGTWGYFFSIDEVPELGAFLVMYGAEHVAAQPFTPYDFFLATRTTP